MITAMRKRLPFIALGIVAGLTFNAFTVFAWTGPTASPPNGNVDAPVNVGSTLQVKNGDLSVNNFISFGNSLISCFGRDCTQSPTYGPYLNFDNTSGGTYSGANAGYSGYGIRDHSGTLEFKNVGGSWQSLASMIGSGFWLGGANNVIYYNQGNVGIGTATPSDALNVVGTIKGDWDSGTGGLRPTLQLRRMSNGAYDGTSLQVDTGMGQGLANIVAGAKLDTSAVYRYEGTRGAARISFEDGPMQFFTGPGAGTAGAAVTWSNGNTAAMTIDVSGNVGVGTASPGGKLDVETTAGTNGLLSQNTAGNGVYGVDGNYNSGLISTYRYGVVGSSGVYYGGLGRSDGYSFVGIGNSYVGGISYANAFIYLSDARLKTNVQNMDNGLVTLMKLRPVTFTWKQNAPDGRAGKDDLGFIAQEVEQVIPQAVSTDIASGYKGVDYPKIVPVLVKAVQEQEQKIQDQQAQIDSLEARVAQLESKLSQ